MKLAAISGVNGPFTDEDIARVRSSRWRRGRSRSGAQAAKRRSGRKADACAQAARQGRARGSAGLRRGAEESRSPPAPAQAEPAGARRPAADQRPSLQPCGAPEARE